MDTILVSDFTQQLSQLYEQHGESLQMLVSSFRKRNSELRKERYANNYCFICRYLNNQISFVLIYRLINEFILCIIFRPSCPSTLFQTWETFLQEIEADSVTATDIAKTLSRQVSNHIIVIRFKRN